MAEVLQRPIAVCDAAAALGAPVAVICHDSGGAEILSSYLARSSIPPLLVLDGPAVGVFERKLRGIEQTHLDDALNRAAWVLAGTSWQSDLEWNAIERARRAGRFTVAFLDHWINYEERFVRRGQRVLPDEIWVGDQYAAEIARATFASHSIKVLENPYFEDVRREFAALKVANSPRHFAKRVLYVCEPMREHGLRHYGDERYFGYVEEEAVQYFLDHVNGIAPRVERVVIRSHPSEPAGKYAWTLQQRRFKVELSRNGPLIGEIAAADVIVGCESMAMVVALIGGKRVISAIPPGGRSCALPHPQIEKLQELIGQGRR